MQMQPLRARICASARSCSSHGTKTCTPTTTNNINCAKEFVLRSGKRTVLPIRNELNLKGWLIESANEATLLRYQEGANGPRIVSRYSNTRKTHFSASVGVSAMSSTIAYAAVTKRYGEFFIRLYSAITDAASGPRSSAIPSPECAVESSSKGKAKHDLGLQQQPHRKPSSCPEERLRVSSIGYSQAGGNAGNGIDHKRRRSHYKANQRTQFAQTRPPEGLGKHGFSSSSRKSAQSGIPDLHVNYEHHPQPGLYEPQKQKRLQKRKPPRNILPSQKLAYEESTVDMTNKMINHDRLGRELRSFIDQKLKELDGFGERQSEEWRSAQEIEVKLLQDTFNYINCRPVPEPVKRLLSQHLVRDPLLADNVFQTPRVPPFPNYNSSMHPIALNKALHALLSARPVPRNVIPKICYNLLTSSSAPDTWTYNILIRGLTLLRQNLLADVVFREMMKCGEPPDNYTVTALLNLMVKIGDYEGWRRIVRIQKLEEDAKKRDPEGRKTLRRSKWLLETLIVHAAMFGKRKLIRRYINAMKAYWPSDPEPGKVVLTALIRFYSEKGEYRNGQACWVRLLKMDTQARAQLLKAGNAVVDETGFLQIPKEYENSSNILDDRSWYWWLKHCKDCKMVDVYERWKETAKQRGVDVEELMRQGPKKWKGLLIRGKNKTPILGRRRTLQDWWDDSVDDGLPFQPTSFQADGDKSVGDINSPGLEDYQAAFLEAAKQVITEARKKSAEDETIGGRQKNEATGDVVSKLLVIKAEARKVLDADTHKRLLSNITIFLKQHDEERRVKSLWIPMGEIIHPREKAQLSNTDKDEQFMSTPGLRGSNQDIPSSSSFPLPPCLSSRPSTSSPDDSAISNQPVKKNKRKIPEPTKLVSDSRKSAIWQRILVRRLDELSAREEALEIRQEAGGFHITEEERRRREILAKWKMKRNCKLNKGWRC